MVGYILSSTWAIYAQRLVLYAAGLSHRQSLQPIDHSGVSVAKTEDHLTFTLPRVWENQTASRLPSNEESELVADVDNSNEDVDNLKEIEELMQHTVSPDSIELEKEELQTSGLLPSSEPLGMIPPEGKDQRKYSEGVSDTAKIFDSATSTIEGDNMGDGENEDERLTRELNKSMSVLSELPSLENQAFIQPT